MTIVTSRLEARLQTIPGVPGARTVVALPPSDADPLWDEMRVDMNPRATHAGILISRAFDPGEDIVTGAPIPYVGEDGVPYVGEDGVPYVTEVAL